MRNLVVVKLFLFLLVLPSVLLRAQGLQENDPTLWPEPERSFYQDGPGLLLSPEQRTELRGFNPEARAAWIRDFLAKDAVLREGIERRSRLAADQYLSLQDARAQLLFLNGMPDDRLVIDCGTVFVPLELWTYRRGIGTDGKPLDHALVVYRPEKDQPYRLWLPSDSKRVLYTEMMQYWLQQWEELRGKIIAVRFDIQNCKEVLKVDEATGVPGLTGALAHSKKAARIRPKDNSSFLAAPADLAAWARAAAATELPPLAPELKGASAQVRFPDRDGQRLLARTLVSLPADAGFKLSDDKRPVAKLVVEGLLEQEGKSFEDFRMRFQVPPTPDGQPLELAIDRSLRPRESFVLRLRIKDEVSGAETRVSRGFRVPLDPTPEPPSPHAIQGELIPAKTMTGTDGLLLMPPTEDVITGIWRAQALVTGDRIQKVIFLVDGKQQLTTTKQPFSAEVRLERFPTEQTVRAEGYDAEGKLVASDEVILNQPRGSFNVRIVSPSKGAKVTGNKALARAEVVVPDGRRIQTVEFKVNDQTVATMAKPPWEAEVAVPKDDLVYLTVQATLDDGARAEAVRYLRSPQFVSEVEVNLVEMYTAVTDRSGDLVNDLKADDFEVTEAGQKQEIVKFELVQNLPLTVGILLDTSGSMAGSLVETQKAATGFLESVMTPRDRAFAVSFARRPVLLMPPTDDVGAVVEAISGIQAVGDTALHDALVHSLYYFRGVQGQRALVLLSDGDDNASYMTFKDALEYAGRSGVAVYAIGLNLSAFDASVKSKLKELAEATGGRAFWSDKPEELQAIYKQIEAELRSRYLLAYNSTDTSGQGGFRAVEVKVKRPGLKARTARGYYP